MDFSIHTKKTAIHP